jgi:hypothetical protein
VDTAYGREVLQYILHPATVDDFEACVDTRIIHVARPYNRALFKGWFSKSEMDLLLRTQELRYTLNLNVTKYDPGSSMGA